MRNYTVVYALVRSPSSVLRHECHHHVAYVTAAYVDEAIARCQQDALSGFVFQLVVAFYGHAERCAKGDDVRVHDFTASAVSP